MPLNDKQKSEFENALLKKEKDDDPKKRASYTHRYTTKLEDRLKDISDINYLLDKLPSSSSKKAVSEQCLYDAMGLVEKLLTVLGPLPISPNTSGEPIVAKQNLIAFPDSNGMAEFRYKATPEEKRLWEAVQRHIDSLKKIYDANNIDLKLYTFEEYRKMMEPKVNDLFSKGVKYTCTTNPGLIPGSIPVSRAKELGYGGIDMRLSIEEQELQRQENERRARETRERELKSK